MKKLTTLLIALLLSLSVSIALVSCGDSGETKCTHVDKDDNGKCDECGTAFEDGKDVGEPENPGEPENLEFTGISFNGNTVTYDNSEHVIEVSGSLPEGTVVTYTNNKGTNAGTYNATATLACEGYNTKTLTATLIISKADITGITYVSKAFTYDGQEKALLITGTLPDGADVAYTSNKGTNANTYDATATISGTNYNQLVLTATLTINKATIAGISAEAEQSVKENGQNHKPSYTGTLPSGVSVKYVFDGTENANGVSAAGTYDAKIVISGSNYITLELPVSFKIKVDLLGLAGDVIDSFGSVPDPWSFLPESFNTENFVSSNVPDYSNYVTISSIPTNGRGKQLNAVYTILNTADTALGYVNTVYASLNVVKTLYSAFLDGTPDNYKHFEDNAGAFTFVIDITDDAYLLNANFGAVSLTLYSNLQNEEYGVKIQLTDSTIMKCHVSEDSFTIALDVLDTKSTLIEFWRNDDGLALGMIYDYLSLADKTVSSTKALIEVGENYTVITGNKGDFLIGGDGTNCEVYENETGRFVGAEVRETTSVAVFGEVTYNTYWFPLASVNGITSIKKEDTLNVINPDTIWINGYADDTFHSALFGGISAKSASRMFDIEFKTMYFYTCNSETGEYESVEIEVPMIFIQEEKIEDFEKKFASENKDALNKKSVTLTVKAEDFAAITRGYDVVLPAYDKLKDAVTHADITNYCKQ